MHVPFVAPAAWLALYMPSGHCWYAVGDVAAVALDHTSGG